MIAQIQELLSSLPNRLRRVTTGSNFIPEIDGLRFLAIFPVVFQHFSERLLVINPPIQGNEKSFAGIMSHGHIGVYIFFAVSGFILSLPFARQVVFAEKKVSLGNYYLRRVTRLEPPYLISMTGFFLMLIFIQHQAFKDLVPHYLASVFYVHRIFYNTWTPINPPAWTLEVEVQFYLLAPFLALGYFSIARRWVRRSLLISLILLKIILTNSTTLFDPFYLTLVYLFEFFLVGVLMADVFLTDWKSMPKKSRLFDWLTGLSIIVLFSSWTWEKNLSWKFIFIAALFMTVYGAFRSVQVNKLLKNAWITALGGMCYTIYLLHLGFIEFFISIYKKMIPGGSYLFNYVVGFLLCLPVLLLVCIAFFLLIEKPCMDPHWPSKLKVWLRARMN